MRNPLHGPMLLDGEEACELSVMSGYGAQGVWETFLIHPPKIIVGVSLTVPGESREHGGGFPKGVWTFPAVLDTGCNRALEIDERHLLSWAGLKKEYLVCVKPDHRGYDERPCEVRVADIWLHTSPYTTPDPEDYTAPHRLEKSTHIRVMRHVSDKPWPRLPILGLQALTANELDLAIDIQRRAFKLSRGKARWRIPF